jgi:hydrogenase maturation protein HypF
MAARQIERGLNAPLASSMGRLFDAAAAVLGVRVRSPYEGAAAMRLEALAGALRGRVLPLPATEVDGAWVLDPVPLLTALAIAVQRGEHRRALAADFHTSVAAGAAALARRLAADAGVTTVVLAGGVFQNARLLTQIADRLGRDHRVLVARRLGPNDGALSYGQAAVAAARLAAGGQVG